MARNLALQEMRRLGREVPIEEIEGGGEVAVAPRPGPDHGLRKLILECLGKLPAKPAAAAAAVVRRAHGIEQADM